MEQRTHRYGPSTETHNMFGANIPVSDTSASELVFRITRDSEARIVFSGPVTQEGIAKLTALLTLSKDAFPSMQELKKPMRAMWHNKDVDQPVTVIGEAGMTDGRRYVKIEGSDTAIPEDEISYTA